MFKIIVFILISTLCNANSHDKKIEAKIQSEMEEYAPRNLPEIEFYGENDKKYILEDFDEKIIVLHFWATWCTICVNEMSELDRLAKDFKKQIVKIIPISEDFKGESIVKEFYTGHNIKNLDIYIDKKNKLFAEFKIIGLPTTIFINKNNKEIGRISGKADWYDENLRNKILSLN